MIRVGWGAATATGNVRRHNEDAVLADPPVFVVADGMGGHAAGEVASRMVVEHFSRLAGREDVEPREIGRVLAAANDRILEAGRRSPESRGMGSTVVGLVLVTDDGHDHAAVFNVGDSRLYRFAGGALEQVTVDHTYVQELVDAGSIGPDEARAHPERNVVTRALGSLRTPQADYWLFSPEPGERYVLCTDGLTVELTATAVAAVLADCPDPARAAEALVRSACDAGGRDNVSVVVVDVLAPGPP